MVIEMKMFDWVRSFFTKEEPNRYAISVRQYEVGRTKTLEEAEQYLQDLFDDIDSQHKGGRALAPIKAQAIISVGRVLEANVRLNVLNKRKEYYE